MHFWREDSLGSVSCGPKASGRLFQKSPDLCGLCLKQRRIQGRALGTSPSPSFRPNWGNKTRATCFATLLQNELNSDVARFTTHKNKRCNLIVGEQGWRSRESTHLSPVWPGFESWRRRHMWAEFVVGSLPCFERFFSGYSGFPLSLKNQHFQIPIRSGTHRHVSTSSYELLSDP